MKSLICNLLMASALLAGEIETATLSGRVTDPSGAVVPGMVVRLINRDGGEVVSVTSDRRGEYRAASLKAGSYDVAAEIAGFDPFFKGPIFLRAGETVNLEVALKISTLSEQAIVTAKAPSGEGALETSPVNSLESLEIREVRESVAKDLGEALSNLDGVWKVRKAGIANDVVVRGFQRGNIDVLIDGMRLYEACPSQMDPAAYHVDFAEVQTVDVTKGPFDFRNQGSLGGSVHVLLKEPEGSFRVTPNFNMGSFNFYNPSLMASVSKGMFHFLAGASYRRSDMYKDGLGRSATQYANYTPAGADNPAFASQAGWARIGVDLSRNQTLDISWAHQADDLTLYPVLRMDAVWDTTDRFNGKWSLRELTGFVKTVRAQLYLTQVKQWMTDEYRMTGVSTPLGYSMGTISGTRAFGGRLETELPNTLVGTEVYDRGWSVATQMKGSMGTTYTWQRSVPDVRMMVGGFFAQHGRTFGRLHITFAGRVDAAKAEARTPDLNTDIYYAYRNTRTTSASDVDPAGNIRLTYLLPKGIELFAGAGSTVRLPDPEERYYGLKRMGGDWVGNPNLRPTRNNEVDLGINLRNQYFSLRPTLFYSRLHNFIAVNEVSKINPVMGVANSNARSYENVDGRVFGGEVSYSVGFGRSLLLAGGLSYVRGIQYANLDAGMPRSNMAETPPLKSRASLRYGSSQFFAEINGLVTARQDKIDPRLLERSTAGYGIVGVKGGIHHKQLNLSGGVENLTNRYYYEHLSFQRDPDRLGVRIPEPGRTFYLNLSYNFE